MSDLALFMNEVKADRLWGTSSGMCWKTALTLDGGKAGVCSAVETERKELVYDFAVEGLNVMFVNGVAAEGFSLS